MKTIYELVYTTTDKVEHNLLFSSKRRAYENLQEHYFEGASIHGVVILSSFIVDRTLF